MYMYMYIVFICTCLVAIGVSEGDGERVEEHIAPRLSQDPLKLRMEKRARDGERWRERGERG